MRTPYSPPKAQPENGQDAFPALPTTAPKPKASRPTAASKASTKLATEAAKASQTPMATARATSFGEMNVAVAVEEEQASQCRAASSAGPSLRLGVCVQDYNAEAVGYLTVKRGDHVQMFEGMEENGTSGLTPRI